MGARGEEVRPRCDAMNRRKRHLDVGRPRGFGRAERNLARGIGEGDDLGVYFLFPEHAQERVAGKRRLDDEARNIAGAVEGLVRGDRNLRRVGERRAYGVIAPGRQIESPPKRRACLRVFDCERVVAAFADGNGEIGRAILDGFDLDGLRDYRAHPRHIPRVPAVVGFAVRIDVVYALELHRKRPRRVKGLAARRHAHERNAREALFRNA